MVLALLALSLSIDALAVGVSLGMEGIRVSRGARCVVCCLSMAAALASMLLGSGLAAICSPQLAGVIGATILFGMGLWIVVSGLLRSNPRCQGAMDEITLFEVAFRSLGITLRILKSPESSDTDRSGNIDAAESLPLGLALSLDMLGTGVGLGAMGMAPLWMPAAVGLCQVALLSLGLRLGGGRLAHGLLGRRAASVVSGGVLIGLAVLRVL